MATACAGAAQRRRGSGRRSRRAALVGSQCDGGLSSFGEHEGRIRFDSAGDLVVSSTIYFHDFNTDNNAPPNYTDPFNRQTGYSLWNAQLLAKDLMGSKLMATVFVKNLTNKVYYQNLTTALSSFGYATAVYGDPRMWGVTLRYHF